MFSTINNCKEIQYFTSSFLALFITKFYHFYGLQFFSSYKVKKLRYRYGT
jgi:hypothetical protein